MLRGEAAAADAFGVVGWDYDRALMLSLLDDEPSLREAIGIARGLGAAPLEARVTRRMQALGMTIPRGPRPRHGATPKGSRLARWRSSRSSPAASATSRSPSAW